MNPERYERLRELFAAVYELPDEERVNVLERECADDPALRQELEALLARHTPESSFLERSVVATAGADASATRIDTEGELVGKRIGHYHLKRVIASGGMGTVYEAMQERPRRTVAIKVMRHGIVSRSALRRFEYESQILARLQHPGIAQVFEAGTWEEEGGAPYFVMEYIPNATPITDYADRTRLGTRERLELFAQVCEAVQHGHQKGIIHRDLKPANILVDSDGQPKIIDFGVARATDSDLAITTLQTDVGQLIGTLQYMSPEQCEADPHDIDTRSDVYALGVVLYELLSGKLPYDVKQVAVYEALKLIREQDPTRLSTVNRRLRGDVETLVLKALQKDRGRRYQSAVEFAQDIQRYLAGEPITARPPSIVYQLRVFARRNRQLFTAAAVLFVVLVAGVIVSTSLYFRSEAARADAVAAQQNEKNQRKLAEQAQAQAEEARRAEAAQRGLAEERLTQTEWALERAETAAAEARAISDFLVQEVLGAADPERSAGRKITLEEALTNATLSISSAFRDRPHLEAPMRFTLGVTYITLGRYEAAEANLRRFLDLRRQIYGEDDRQTYEAMIWLAWALTNSGKVEEAEQLMRASLEGLRRVAGPEDSETMRVLNDYGNLLSNLGRHDEAEAAVREALDWRKRVLGENAELTLISMNALGGVLVAQSKWTESEAVYRESLHRMRSALGEDHPRTFNALHGLANALSGQGRLAEAETLHREALERRRRVQGEDHPDTEHALQHVTALLTRQGKEDEAEALLRADLVRRRAVHGQQSLETAESTETLADWLAHRGRDDEAQMLRTEALEIRRQNVGAGDAHLAASLTDLAIIEHREGNLSEARRLVQEAITIHRRAGHDDTDPQMARARLVLAVVMVLQGESEAGEQLHAEILANQAAQLGDIHPETLNLLENSVTALMRRGLTQLARRYTTDAIAAHKRIAERPDADASALNEAAWLLLTCEPADLRDPAAAVPMAERAIELDGGTTPMTLDTLALAYQMSGDLDRAIETQRRALLYLPVNWSWMREEVEGRLVQFLEQKGDPDGAEQVYRETLSLRRETTPEARRDIASALIWLGMILNRHEKYSEAEKHLRECLEIRRQVYSDGEWVIPNTMSILGEAVMGQGRYEEAEPLLREGYVRLKHNPDSRLERVAEARQRLTKLYELTGEAEKLRQLREE